MAASKGTARKPARGGTKKVATSSGASRGATRATRAAKATTRVKRGGAVMARKEEGRDLTGVRTLRRRRAALAGELGALAALALGTLLLLALLSHHPADRLVGQWGDSGGVRNWVGPFGAWVSELAVSALGITAFGLPLHLGLLAVSIFTRRGGRVRLSEGLGLIGVVSATALIVELVVPSLTFRGGVLHGGGGLGQLLLGAVSSQLGRPGAWVVGLTLLAGSMRVAFGVRVLDLLRRVFGHGGVAAVGAAGASARGARGLAGHTAGLLERLSGSVRDGVEDWRAEREARREEQRWAREERLAQLDEQRLLLAEEELGWSEAEIAAPGRTLVPELMAPVEAEYVDPEPAPAPSPPAAAAPSTESLRAAADPGSMASRPRPSVVLPRRERPVMSSRRTAPPADESAPPALEDDPARRQDALSKLQALTGVLQSPESAEPPRVDSMRGATARGVVHAEIRVPGARPKADAGQRPAVRPSAPEEREGADLSQDVELPPDVIPPEELLAEVGDALGELPLNAPPRIQRVAPRSDEAMAKERIMSARRMLAASKPFELPSLSLLQTPPETLTQVDEDELQRQAVRLEETLATYGVPGRVTNILPGPVVTMFEFEPGPGIKVSKIANLGDDLAMALRAVKVRIVAPIPGKGAVGIEIPSAERETVYFREVLASRIFAKVKSKPLPLALGKGVDGSPVVADMSKFPHILIAGTTGSGKSVCVNSIILSLLFTRTPDEVRLILVDPKMLEFSIYDGIPHLLVPVVTSPKKAAVALNWAVMEMTRRYKVLAAMGCRNITSYNERSEQLGLEWDAYHAAIRAGKDAELPECGRALGEDTVVFRSRGDEPVGAPEKMPFIVIIIDELSDLMMVARKEVEESIVRLAQMARACGIHMLLATQRPSVDVITGLIKANFPSRLSFRVSSKVDSRTVLDANGAESLLGMGDGLFLPPGVSEVTRVHGAFISDEEVQRTVDHLKTQGEPNYVEAVLTSPDEDGADSEPEGERDEMYDQCVAVVAEVGKASTSLLQRRLKLGYNRAARIMDTMEREGVIGPQDGARPREVYVRPYDD